MSFHAVSRRSVYSVVELSMSSLSFSHSLPLSPGSASFHSSVSNKEENRRDTAPIRKQDINTLYQINDSSYKSSPHPIATLYTSFPSIFSLTSSLIFILAKKDILPSILQCFDIILCSLSFPHNI